MGFKDKMKDILGIEIVDEEEEEEVEVQEAPKASSGMTKLTPANERPEPRSYKAVSETSSNPVISNTARLTGAIKMGIFEPRDINDCPKLVDNLKAKKPVIINLENLETDVARKIFDFLSGAVYALNGNAQKINNNIFLFAPENVDVSVNDGLQKASETYKSAWK